MKALIKNFLLVLVTLMITTCEVSYAQKFYSSGIDVNELNRIGYLKPISFIQLVDQGNKGKFSDSLSLMAQDSTLEIINENKIDLKLDQYVEVVDSTTKAKLLREFNFVINQALVKQKTKKTIVLPKTIDSLFTEKNIRFGLMTATMGFTRVKGNLGKQIGKGIATGILTLGMYSQSPVKAGSTIHTIIVDTQNDLVIFYNHSSLASEPLNKKSLNKQFRALFEKYFILK